MKNTMFFASYKDAFGKEHANLYFDWNSFHSDTFSPECEVIQLIEFATHGKNYRERKNSLEEIAIEFSHNAVCGLSYGEIYHIQNFFEIIWTNAPDHVIKAQLMYIAACEEEGKQVPENPYGMIEEFGYIANVIGSQDSLTTEDLEDAIIDAEFDYYDLQEGG